MKNASSAGHCVAGSSFSECPPVARKTKPAARVASEPIDALKRSILQLVSRIGRLKSGPTAAQSAPCQGPSTIAAAR